MLDAIFNEELSKYPEKLVRMTGIDVSTADMGSELDRMMADRLHNVTMADSTTDPNANVGNINYSTVLQEASKGAMRRRSVRAAFRKGSDLFGLDFAKRMLKSLIEGEVYFSDLHMFDAPYCYNFSTNWLMNIGLPFLSTIPSDPPKHADTFLQQCEQMIMYASNNQAGACALTGFFWALNYFLKKDEITSKKAIKQMFQEFVYTINQPFRFSNQSPFLNLSLFDRYYLEALYGNVPYPDGTFMEIDDVIALEKLFGEWFVDEIAEKKRIFTFPVITVCLKLDKVGGVCEDVEFRDWACETNAKFGTFNFYISEKTSSLSSCCRLSNDVDLLQQLGYVNSFGAGGDGIGSTGVVTVNIPHVFAKAGKDGVDAREALKEAIDVAQKSAYVRRKLVEDNITAGLLPLYKHGFIDIDSQYCTVGFCGMYEAARISGVIKGSFTYDKYDDYIKFATEMLGIFNGANMKASKSFGVPFNLEQVPAEGQAIKLADKDREQNLQSEFVMYANQWFPLSEGSVDVYSRIKMAGELDRKCSGGAILHITTGTKVTGEVQKRLLDFAAKNGVIYFAFNYTLVKCNSCGEITVGDTGTCPKCGANDLDAYTRVVGFITPVKHWHRVRRDDFHKRKRYSNLDPRQKEMKEIK